MNENTSPACVTSPVDKVTTLLTICKYIGFAVGKFVIPLTNPDLVAINTTLLANPPTEKLLSPAAGV